VQSGDKWSYIDETGIVIIQPTYGAARQFHEGLAAVEIGGMWGYIQQDGVFRMQSQYASATEFSDGLAVVLPNAESPYKVIEPPRLCWRLQPLRGLEHGQTDEVSS
jgi:hypothetical protein